MKIPPLLMSVTLVFWGVESGNLIVSIVIALLLGSVLVVPTRLNLSDDDFVRVSDLTSVIFLSAVVLIMLNVKKVLFLKTLVLWMPVILLPLILAQLYTGREKIIIGTRLGFRKKEIHKHDPLDFRFYYFALSLFSAAIPNSRSPLFFPVVGLLVFWILFENRSRSFPLWVFITVFVGALGFGFVTFKGAEVVHEYVRYKTRMFFRGYYFSQDADPFKSKLSFGTIGKLKSSGDILLRVEASNAGPTILRQASYEMFNQYTWYSNEPFAHVGVSRFGWDLMASPKVTGSRARIEYYLPKEQGLLPQPYGSYRLTGPTIYEIEQKRDGITKIIDGASLISYDIFYNSKLSNEDVPSHRNVSIHPEEDKLIGQVTSGWKVDNLSEVEKIALIRKYFADDFTYSIDVSGQGDFETPLENFLFGNKSGYCEQFATATALLLRKIGIPSRYVTGFVVEEKSKIENKYIVRDRHAHAWSEAYVGGRWVMVDTTPADWFALETANRPRLEILSDLFAYIKLKIDHFRIRTEQNYELVLSILTVLLALILVIKIYRRINSERIDAASIVKARIFDEIDSPLYAIEKQLMEFGVPRYRKEPFLTWVERIQQRHTLEVEKIKQIYRLHQKLRFDPVGLATQDRNSLKALSESWLARVKDHRKPS
ncbi:transglutaminase-like domain-containing protein [Desulfosediminicola flagellatus]|uniref:transglutaminase-like domain-containing protein n=1 Tax=Desulfosediminicola flagellatus TaxID=2569541 RepID=UPI0010AB9032|nr:transglutaminase-like domain-containing protein [Desulfosediminicola flagellatus]